MLDWKSLGRFSARVEGGEPFGDLGPCWLWTGGLTHDGYPQFYVGGRVLYAHRVAHEWLVGPIPDGLQLDHLCRVRRCVSPDHMEPVTGQTNVLRGSHPNVIAHHAGMCVRGLHPLSGDNRLLQRGGRGAQCRECKLNSMREWRARNNQKVGN